MRTAKSIMLGMLVVMMGAFAQEFVKLNVDEYTPVTTTRLEAQPQKYVGRKVLIQRVFIRLGSNGRGTLYGDQSGWWWYLTLDPDVLNWWLDYTGQDTRASFRICNVYAIMETEGRCRVQKIEFWSKN